MICPICERLTSVVVRERPSGVVIHACDHPHGWTGPPAFRRHTGRWAKDRPFEHLLETPQSLDSPTFYEPLLDFWPSESCLESLVVWISRKPEGPVAWPEEGATTGESRTGCKCGTGGTRYAWMNGALVAAKNERFRTQLAVKRYKKGGRRR